MKVIVAGYPKTGTKTMATCLTHLGYSVYDVLENIVYFGKEYKTILQHGWTTEDFRKMYEDVDAVVDMPACLFWEDILKAFPDAKVILTVRNNEDEWCKSLTGLYRGKHRLDIRFMEIFSPTARYFCKHITSPGYVRLYGSERPDPWAFTSTLNKQMAKKRYRVHNAYVMQTVPKDRLLVFNVSQGWDPLCKFLDVPLPDIPFPHRNVKGGMIYEKDEHPLLQQLRREAWISFTTIALATGTTIYLSYKYGPMNIARSTHAWMQTIWNSIWLH